MKNGDILTNLLKARALVANPETWCQWRSAEDKWGYSVPVTSPAATRWCSAGAVQKVDLEDCIMRDLLERAAVLLGFGSIVTANDRFGQLDALKVWDAAITYVMLCIAAHIPVELEEES